MLPEGIRVPGCMIKPATEHTWQPGLSEGTGVTWQVTLPGISLGISDYSEGCAAQGTRVYKVRGSTPSPSWDVGRSKHSSCLALSHGRAQWKKPD